MIHDRVSFGGVLVAIGIIYVWLSEFALRRGEGWAWWALAASGGAGFVSFLSYLGYGYLDTWHGVGTLVLLPLYAVALLLTRARRSQRAPFPAIEWTTRRGPPADRLHELYPPGPRRVRGRRLRGRARLDVPGLPLTATQRA